MIARWTIQARVIGSYALREEGHWRVFGLDAACRIAIREAVRGSQTSGRSG